MEVEEMQAQSCKFPRIRNGNGRIHESAKTIGQKREDHPCPDEEEADGEVMMKKGSSGGGGGRRGSVGLDISAAGGLGRLCGWPSSRIVRVSRASGGKDRHSKVWTSKGLRDRRVRLSVNTAIQFYDLQDRLGYDQPSKAVEWLLKAAASSIAELPSINTSFPETPQQLSDEKRSSAGTDHGFDSAEVEMEAEPANFQQQQQQQQHGTLSKSACSSTSETSKGSGLSLSRSESRIKARERARERAAEKEKEKENESSRAGQHQQQHQNVNPISQSSSFTELLTSGINGAAAAANVSNTSNNSNNTTSPNGSVHQNAGRGGGGGGGGGTSSESSLFQKSPRQWSSTMDYFTTGLLGPPSSTRPAHQSSTGFLGQIQLGNHLQQSLASVSSPLFSITGDHHSEIPHFSFVPDHLVPVVTTAAGGSNNDNSGNGEYNLNFTMSSSSSSGLAGFNRGTLQSNSSTPSLLPQIQRFTPIDGQSAFYISTAAPQNAAVAPMENNHHHHFLPRFDAGLQLCYGDGGRHSDHKGKQKN